jgi:O-antigen ligase
VRFYLLGGQQPFVESFEGSDDLYRQAQYRFLQAGDSIMVAVVATGLYVFAAAGAIQRQRKQVLAFCFLLFLVVVIVQVRSTWVALAVGLALTPLLTRKWLASLSAVTAIVPVFLIVSLYNVQGQHFLATITKSAVFVGDSTADETATYRQVLWLQAWEQALENPILGSGLGGYYNNVGPNGAPVTAPLHNGYLTLFLKFGAVGALLFTGAVILWLHEVVDFARSERCQHDKLLAGAFAVSAVMLATFAFFYDFGIPFWIVLGLGTALVNRRRAGVARQLVPVSGRSHRLSCLST